MKIMLVIMIIIAIMLLWIVAHVMYKPAYDKIKKEYVSDEDGIKLAVFCTFVMLALAFTAGLLI